MFEFIDAVQQRRRLIMAIAVVAFVIIDLILLSFLASTAKANNITTTKTKSNPNVIAQGSDNANAVADAMSSISSAISQSVSSAGRGVMGVAASTSIAVSDSGKYVEHGLYASATFIGHGAFASASFVASGVGLGAVQIGRGTGTISGLIGRGYINNFSFANHAISGNLPIVGRAIANSFSFTGQVASGGLPVVERGFIGNVITVVHGLGYIARVTTHISNPGAVIKPADIVSTPTPRIAKLRAEQAEVIQKDTSVVPVKPVAVGSGGACDMGEGNGGYPISWCSAPMDSVSTIPYGSGLINRECTSYAYWYFINVEGHKDFRARGDAKYWVRTSNYPIHRSPAVGSIAVETVGAYGHVAIVQALPGQKYSGHIVPAGYVLVSEMNYDWNGHFRYSYSPISKFSAYIHP